MSIDVFFCYVVNKQGVAERLEMAQECYLRWYSKLDRAPIRLTQHAMGGLLDISDEYLEKQKRRFQRFRRKYADENASSPIYIVTDDDYLIPENLDISACVKILDESVFDMLSLMPSNVHISEWTPDNDQTASTDEIMEHRDVGGVRFCKKPLLQHWPEMEPNFPGYDRIQCEQIRKEGGRVGYFKRFHAEHLGEGKSSVWAAHGAHR